MTPPVRLVVYSDYLCPWCYNAAVRLRRVEQELGDALVLEWRSFLLRPQLEPRTMEQFRRYTESWRRPAAEPDGGTFQVWASDAGPPSHSVPPHLVAKAAAALGSDAFRAVHERLLHAYFAENRDITHADTLAALWQEAGLPGEEFVRVSDPALLERVAAEHNAAIAMGVTGVPAAFIEGVDVPILGAHPIDVYRRWVRRFLAPA